MLHQVEGGLTVGLSRTSLAVAICCGLGGGPAGAAGIELDGPAIWQALEDRCVGGIQHGLVWQQDFRKGGMTIYRASGERPSEGRWRVNSDRFCSQWPPSRAWTCYAVIADGDDIAFVPDDGGDVWHATIKPARR